jgi:hypothetical protein
MILIIGKGEKDLSRKSRDFILFIFFFVFEKEEESACFCISKGGKVCDVSFENEGKSEGKMRFECTYTR